MNIIWMLMIIISMGVCFLQGNVNVIQDVFLEIGEETYNVVIPLLCVTAFWNGILYVAKDCGILQVLERLLHPLLKRLFPDLKDDRETLGYIASNIVVNMVGLGSAATPVGLKAMQNMQEHNPNKSVATRSMVTFLVLNTAGVTLFSTTLIGIRASYGSQDVTSFLPFAIVSTCFASIIGLAVDRWRNYRE